MTNKADALAAAIRAYDGPPIRLMEVCGTHTHQISRFGIPSLLPENIELISGPGCPVCVTPAGYIDRAAEIATRPGCTVLSYGDMIRVPGNKTSLLAAKAAGGSVLLMYSPMDALRHAAREPDRLFYVTAVGFETTLPLYALLVKRLAEEGVENIRLLLAARALLPALEWICENDPDIDGFLGPGHVSAILGSGAYESVCARYGVPMAVAGFSYEHLIAAIASLIRQVRRGVPGTAARFGKTGRHQGISQEIPTLVRNLYPSAVSREGNAQARALIAACFTRGPSVWRGLGEIAGSGYRLAPEFAAFDAGFSDGEPDAWEPEGCLCGQVIIGRAKPLACGFFGTACTPEHPIGPCMVSSEGTCGIWHATARKR